MEYTILQADSATELAVMVEDAMTKGWLPQGGIAVHGDMFYQAMIRIGHERVAFKATAQPEVVLG